MDWRCVRTCAVLSLVFALILLSGCTGSTTTTPPGPGNPRSPILVSIAVTPANKSVPVGQPLQFKATGTFSDNSTQDLTNSATWASSNTTVATISSTGLTTDAAAGQSTISATQGPIAGSTPLTVTTATLVSIAVTPANSSVPVSQPLQFKATGTFSDNSTQDLTNSATWASSTTAAATISSTGLATGVAAGPSTISATQGSITGSTTLTVTTATLVSIAVTPANSSVPVGQPLQFKATGTFSDNSTQDLTSSVTWASSNPGVATIDSAGLAKGVTSGQSTTISATQSPISGSTTLSVTAASGFAGVFTYHNDSSRTGQNLNEMTLTPSNVNVNTFGKLFSQPVDGQIYAQPLYVPNVAVSGKGTHNVIFVATEVDSVYAFDADNKSGANASPLWKASLIDTGHGAASGATPVTSNDVSCTDLQPNIGVTATPVIDRSSGTMYVEAKSKENGSAVHRLHAIDIATGNEKFTPVVINATVAGTGDGSSNGQLNFAFMAMTHNSRPGLLLLNGIVYLGFASHCDNAPYHGWVFAYDTSSSMFTRKDVYVSTPNGVAGGTWHAGGGFAADANGNIFLSTGNGSFDSTQRGDSILKFSGSNLSVVDYFTPFNQGDLWNHDADLASGGALLLPDQPGSHAHELVQVGKEGRVYLVDRDQMTAGNQHYCSGCGSDPEIVEESAAGLVGTAQDFSSFATPAYWNGTVYFWGVSDTLKAIPLSNGTLDFTRIAKSQTSYQFPGATPSISANGTSNGIVWSIDSSQYGLGGPGLGPAVLHAHDAKNVANELWNSSLNGVDRAGNAVKFAVPTIANGKVYIGTSSEVDVYGLH